MPYTWNCTSRARENIWTKVYLSPSMVYLDTNMPYLDMCILRRGCLMVACASSKLQIELSCKRAFSQKEQE